MFVRRAAARQFLYEEIPDRHLHVRSNSRRRRHGNVGRSSRTLVSSPPAFVHTDAHPSGLVVPDGMNSYNRGMNAIVSEKGQVTIPKKLRDRLGIKPGEVLEFSEDHGRLVATKVRPRDPVDNVYGILHLEGDVDAFVDDVRGAAQP